jgi:predicted ATPase
MEQMLNNRFPASSTGNTTSTNQHVVFYERLLSTIQNALHQISGQGSVEDFAYLAHTMVNTQTLFMNPTWRNELGLDNLDFEGMRNRFVNNIGSIEEFQISCN